MGLKPEQSNNNGFWAGLIIEELVRLGCTMFFISPGSRSSPLVSAIGRHTGTQTCVHYDERGGAFAALGYSRTSSKPAVWVTTSGTAVANGLPAVIEASVDSIPLILLTADRPPELKETGANQTIPQSDLFGKYVRWHVDIPTPSDEISPTFVLTTVDQSVYRATSHRGPVHLNCMYRKPLATGSQEYEKARSDVRLSRWVSDQNPYTQYARADKIGRSSDLTKIGAALGRAKRPICVLGRVADIRCAKHALTWAEQSGIPVLPDITSGFRLGTEGESLIPYYDLMTSSDRFSLGMKPDAVIQVGRTPVSKQIQTFLSESPPDLYVLVSDGPERQDPNHLVSNRLDLSEPGVESFFSGMNSQVNVEEEWLAAWKDGSNRIETWLGDRLGGATESKLSEQAVAYRLCSLLPESHQLNLASSLPIRHVNTFSSSLGNPVQIVANRGASGIDGTIATAAGSQRGTGKKTTVLLGDLAMLHDMNSLVLARDGGLILVVLNNNGGGIFEYLPIQSQADVFEPLFATPHGLDFEHAAKQFGLSYHAPTNLTQFSEVYSTALERDTASLIEVKTDRKETKAFGDRLMEEAERVLLGDS